MEFSIVVLILVAIVTVVLLTKVTRLQEKVQNLELQVTRLLKISDRLKDAEDELHLLKPVKESKTIAATPEPVSPPLSISSEVSTASETPTHIVQREKVPEPKSKSREEWEAFIGGKLLNRIGSLALIIGLGFFLKYAFDNNWISETVRVFIGAAVGLCCLGFAYRTNKSGFQIFAQGLAGAGVAILYLSIYAAFNYYALIPQWMAFLLMSVVTTLSLILGLYFNSLAVAVLGWAGGFVTPLILSTDTANEIGLFTYIALVNVGLLAIVFVKKEWQIIEPLSLAATWILYFAWYFRFYHDSDLMVTVFFISMFWFLYFVFDIAHLRLIRASENIVHHLVSIINTVLYFIMLYGLVNTNYHDWMGGITLMLGCIYLGAFWWMRRTLNRVEKIRLAFSALTLSVIAAAIQFEDFIPVLCWSLEAAALVWCGTKWRQPLVVSAAAGLFALTVVKFLLTTGAFTYEPIEMYSLLISERSLSLILLIILFAASAWLTRKENIQMASVFHYAWCIAAFFLLTVETSDTFRKIMLRQSNQTIEYLQFTRLLVLSAVWGALSLPIVWIAVRKNILSLFIPGLVVLFFSVCLSAIRGFTFDPLAFFQPIINIRTGTMIFVFMILIIQRHLISQHQSIIDWLPEVLNAIHIFIVIVLLIVLTGETRDFFERQIAEKNVDSSIIQRLTNLEQLSLSGVWLIYSVALMTFGFWRSLRNIRIIAFILFGFTILKIFIYDLSSLETLYRIFSFIGLGLILLAVSYAYQRYKHIIFGTKEKA
jgi:uncharacterized membrane protein